MTQVPTQDQNLLTAEELLVVIYIKIHAMYVILSVFLTPFP